MRKVLFCVIALLCNSATAQQLSPFEAKYDAFRNDSKLGFAVMSLTKLGNNQFKLYYKSDVSIFFLSDKREETSIFRLDEDGQYIPWKYQYKRTGTGRDKSLSLLFNEDSNQITINQESTINWNGEWDNQLYRFDLQNQLQQKTKDIQYDLINYRGQKKQYGFEVIGTEILELPYGSINAIKVKTIRSNNKRVTYSWFAPDLNYLLVRLQQFKKGDEQGDIQLAKVTYPSE